MLWLVEADPIPGGVIKDAQKTHPLAPQAHHSECGLITKTVGKPCYFLRLSQPVKSETPWQISHPLGLGNSGSTLPWAEVSPAAEG